MTDKKPNTDLNTEIVCRCVEAVLMDLRDKGGIGTAEILAAAHAQTVTMLACFIGGEAAMERQPGDDFLFVKPGNLVRLQGFNILIVD